MAALATGMLMLVLESIPFPHLLSYDTIHMTLALLAVGPQFVLFQICVFYHHV